MGRARGLARDEFPQRAFDGRFLRSLAADRQRLIEQIRIHVYRQILGHRLALLAIFDVNDRRSARRASHASRFRYCASKS